MAFVNYNNKEITVKIVYYGPALSGKTSCLRYIYSNKSLEKKGKLITLDTDGDRTLFFDFLPIELGKIGDYTVKTQLYTVPGQVAYDTTRKLVLQGADGIVYVADSQKIMREQNIESYNNLIKNMKLNNLADKNIPIILHYNKRDLSELLSIDDLNNTLNKDHKPFFSTIATSGENVIEGLQAIMKMVIINLKNKLTVFQKDKTVMFSKDEVTATADVDKEENNIVIDEHIEDNSDDIFELESPVEQIDELEQKDEIFSLDDVNIISDVNENNDDFNVPEQVMLTDEIIAEEPVKIDALKDDNSNKTINLKENINAEFDSEEISLPINITIPDNKDQIKINLNLSIILKRKS